ncbi:hypothetical protein [Bradyrhizobium sp.]|uniref:hypothetical protein n=1 Tax=Bradyrhizobium sp. TaxID=376 RepID=UPI0025C665AF|nr:hypothetical protein [Bradyrhizobium sp.]
MRAALAFFILALPSAGYAQEATLLCALVKDDPARLACFDALTRKPAADRGPTQAAEWHISESRSPLDDGPQVHAVLLSRDGRSSLVLRCHENATEVAFSDKEFLGTGQAIRMTYRIGKNPPINGSWLPSQQGVAAFAPNAGSFLRALPDHEMLFLRATGWRGQSHDGTFDLGKVSEVRERIAMACKWSAAPTGKAKAPK